MLKLTHLIIISLPNCHILKISNIGSVILSANITLHDVLYVPMFKFNLISITNLTKQLQCKVNFTFKACYLQGSSRIRPLLGRTCKELYLFSLADSSSTTVKSWIPHLLLFLILMLGILNVIKTYYCGILD